MFLWLKPVRMNHALSLSALPAHASFSSLNLHFHHPVMLPLPVKGPVTLTNGVSFFLVLAESKSQDGHHEETDSGRVGRPCRPARWQQPGWAGLKRGDFLVSANFSGFMLNVATAGMAPSSSVSGFVLEVLLAGLMRVVAILNLKEFEAVILGSCQGLQGQGVMTMHLLAACVPFNSII